MKAIAFMAALAALDLVGALLARRFSQTGSALVLLAGVAVFSVLFVDLAGGDLRLTPVVGALIVSTLALQVALVKLVPS